MYCRLGLGGCDVPRSFEAVGWATIGVLAALTVIAVVVDFVASAAGARYLGASSRAFWGATADALVGIFFGIPGMLFGPFIGAVLGELGAGRDLLRSDRAGVGAWLGMVFATAVKLAIASPQDRAVLVSGWAG